MYLDLTIWSRTMFQSWTIDEMTCHQNTERTPLIIQFAQCLMGGGWKVKDRMGGCAVGSDLKWNNVLKLSLWAFKRSPVLVAQQHSYNFNLCLFVLEENKLMSGNGGRWRCYFLQAMEKKSWEMSVRRKEDENSK